MKKILLVKDDFINSRLDKWLRKNIGNLPQSLIEKCIRRGNIKVNFKKEKSSYRLKKEDKIILYNINFKPSPINKKKFIYKATKKDLLQSKGLFIENNENFVVINKPAGVAVQSGSKSKRNIVDIIRGTNEFSNHDPYIVHRLDKETTGLLIIAKNRKYAQLLTSLFRIRKIHKTYLGICVGEFEKRKGTLKDILYSYEGNKKIKSNAVTHYTVIDSNNYYSLLKLNPETGRKHQLRKQLLMRGHPIYGDVKYNISFKKPQHKKKMMLHAYKIHFSINENRYNYIIDPPKSFKDFLDQKHLKNF